MARITTLRVRSVSVLLLTPLAASSDAAAAPINPNKTYDIPPPNEPKVQTEPDGSFAYDPAGFVGNDSFFYTVTDGVSEAIGRVVVKVTGTAPSSGPPAINTNVAPLETKP